MSVREDVVQVFKGLGLCDPEIEVEESPLGRLTVVLTSSRFGSMREEERQSMVWQALAESLSPSEQMAIEFVFTNAPDEDTSDQADVRA